jgi:hypothetical protein
MSLVVTFNGANLRIASLQHPRPLAKRSWFGARRCKSGSGLSERIVGCLSLNRHLFATGSADADQSPPPEHDAVCQDVRGLHDCGRHVRRGLPVPRHAHPVGARAMPHAATCLLRQPPGSFSPPAPLFRGPACAADCPPQLRGCTPCAVLARTRRSAGGCHGAAAWLCGCLCQNPRALRGTLPSSRRPRWRREYCPRRPMEQMLEPARWSRDPRVDPPARAGVCAYARGRSRLQT